MTDSQPREPPLEDLLGASGGPRTVAHRALDWAGAAFGRGAGALGTVDRVVDVGRNELPLRPIEPSWIEEGTPVARARILTTSPDGRLSSGVWECSAGKFRWIYGVDEIVHILAGKVIIREKGRSAYTLAPGDVAYFPLGLIAHWNVPRYVKKFFVVRAPGGNRHVARLRQRLDF
jgi:uncharacterized cupin superfamily protein